MPPRPLKLILATSAGLGDLADHPVMAAIDGDPRTGWAVSFQESRNVFLALRFSEPVSTARVPISPQT